MNVPVYKGAIAVYNESMKTFVEVMVGLVGLTAVFAMTSLSVVVIVLLVILSCILRSR